MVSILPSERTGMDVLGRYVGQGMSNAMPQMYENQKREMGMQAIDRLQNAMKPGANGQIDYGTMLADIARAVTLNPGLERSGLIEHAMKRAQVMDQNKLTPPGGQQNPQRGADFLQENPIPQRVQDVNFLNQSGQQNQNFPTPRGAQQKTGNAPQPGTQGEKRALRTPEQVMQDAYARQKASAGTANPLTLEQALLAEDAVEQRIKNYNEEVQADTDRRIGKQKEYGKLGSDTLQKAYPEASPKMLALASKWGEDESLHDKSEAQIKDYVISKANELANTIHNVKNHMSRPNVINNIERAADGSYKSFDKSAQDLRNHLKPLLDMGLYDEARGLLQGLNYGPEEREMIINPLSQRDQTILNSVPNMTGTKSFRKATKAPEGNINDVKEALLELKQANPNFSPLLARKYLEDRGYDWSLFKDAWNELIQGDEGNPEELKNFKLSADQRVMSGFLDTPPLSGLYKILGSMSPELLPHGR
jgi:hypothetical protein